MTTKICVLGSTSSGNSTVIWNNSGALLIDCGFSTKYIRHHLQELNLDIHSLSGVLITHAHSDHVTESMLKTLIKFGIPIYSSIEVLLTLKEYHRIVKRTIDSGLFKTFDSKEFQVDTFTVYGFEVPHDSKGGCWGYNVWAKHENNSKKITIATDMGYPQNGLSERFIDSDLIIIESNHDIEMLMSSSRPALLKQRIREIGHLSNEQCAEFLDDILSNSKKLPQAIILAHISQQCNTSRIATKTSQNFLQGRGHKSIKIITTKRREPTETINLK